MENNSYLLRYLPLFEEELIETVRYITDVLKNPLAANRLLDDVETAIYLRLQNPLAFEPYHSVKKREHNYYRIYVHNYTIYDVVIDHVMEVRRFLSSARNSEPLL